MYSVKEVPVSRKETRCCDGWMGDSCTQATCSSGCGPGLCVGPNTCSCDSTGYTGATCQIRKFSSQIKRDQFWLEEFLGAIYFLILLCFGLWFSSSRVLSFSCVWSTVSLQRDLYRTTDLYVRGGSLRPTVRGLLLWTGLRGGPGIMRRTKRVRLREWLSGTRL